MASGIQFTQYVPLFLTGVNSPSPTLAAEVVTGLPISTGAFPGNCFYLSEQQANQLSAPAGPIMHAGWYMVVQVAANAVAANIAFGLVGHQSTLAGSNTAPGALLVTDASTGLGLGINPVVFLGAVTPGNYTIVQIAGDGQLVGSVATTPAGSILAYGVTGKVVVSATRVSADAGILKVVTAAAGLVRAEIAFPFGLI